MLQAITPFPWDGGLLHLTGTPEGRTKYMKERQGTA